MKHPTTINYCCWQQGAGVAFLFQGARKRIEISFKLTAYRIGASVSVYVGEVRVSITLRLTSVL